jgi:hypothetical protein
LNTEFEYIYRDIDGATVRNSAVVEGQISPIQEVMIRQSLEAPNRFIPAQVGLPEQRFPNWTEDETAWFELAAIRRTRRRASIRESVSIIASLFLKAADNWDPAYYEAAARKGYRAD